MAWNQTDAAQAVRWYEQALTLARELGDREAEAFMLNNLAVGATDLGDYERAIACHEAGLAVARALAEPTPIALTLYNLADLAWRRGQPAAATDRLAEALALAREHAVSWLVPGILIRSGFVAADLGDLARAAATFAEGLRGVGGSGDELVDVIDGLEGLARVGAATGQLDPAARLFGAAEALREEHARPQLPAERAYFAPFLSALRDGLGDGPFAAGWAGGRTLARDEAIAEALAALPAADAAPGPDADPELTGREREVLRLLAGGLSNREIADRLYITPATVARHVANLYGKLGVDTRAKATAFARRHDLS
jgi:ATP/maltotriose-dependent transcriptional regulator MalT